MNVHKNVIIPFLNVHKNAKSLHISFIFNSFAGVITKQTVMKRKIYQKLVEWRDNPRHKPLVLLGARQVGKTYILKQFGNREFDSFVYVNCHNNPFA